MSVAALPVTREREEALISSHRSPLAVLRHLDYALVGLVVLMTGGGVLVLSGAVEGIPELAHHGAKQLAFFWPALAALILSTMIDYRWINRMAVLIYLLNIGALLFVLVGGSRINGARSWIDIGPVNWQPSETMKIATVLVAAQWLALRPEKLNHWLGIIVPGLICGIPAVLVLAQPDLGTASLFFMMFLAMMLMAGAPVRRLLLIIAACGLGAVSAYPMLKPYQKARIMVFLNPEADPRGNGYNVIQSKVTIGNGGLTGWGWGAGTQTTHRFLPEHHTDFIFASAIEQFGFIGGALLLLGYGLILWRMQRAMDEAKDRFGGIVVAGLMAILFSHLLLNVGMTMGLLPCTGIPLPLLSYGGSFLVSTYIIFGLVLNVASRKYTFIGL